MHQDMLRHTLATLAYRGGKAVRGAPASFSGFRPAAGSRSAGEILAHIGDLLDWALWMARGETKWANSPVRAWDDDVSRFHAAMAALDAQLASDDPLGCTPQQLFQGPIADALTHVGQLTMMRRLDGSPVRGENYARAHIAAGRVSAEQDAPVVEFD